MEIEKLTIDGIVYYLVNEYLFKFGHFFKFISDEEEIIYCTKTDNIYEKVTDKRILKKLNNEFKEIIIKDIV